MYVCTTANSCLCGFEKLGPQNFTAMNGAMRAIDHKIMRLDQ